MSERYSKLFALSENLYSLNAPVVIAAGALQKDNQTGKVFAQLKIRNIQDKVIKAATVKLTPFDTVGNPLDGTIDYQYLDISAGRDDDFGQKTPVMFKDTVTRSYSVSVSEVIFSDNSIWTASNEAWEPLSAPVGLESAFHYDSELAKQYRLKYGADCKCVLSTEKDLWRCACGAINRNNEKYCHKCQKEATALATLNMDELKADRDERLAAEQRKAAEEAAAVEAQAKKRKKIAIIAAPILVVLIVAAVLISKSNAYNNAIALLEAEKYDEASSAFTELGEYKDSQERLTEISYRVGMTKSVADTYERLQNANDDGEYIQELLEICNTYIPYCGEFAGMYNYHEMTLSSDFRWDKGEAIWCPKIPDDCVLELVAVSKDHYNFFSSEYQLLDSQMAAKDKWTAYNCVGIASFKGSKINIKLYNDSTSYCYIDIDYTKVN